MLKKRQLDLLHHLPKTRRLQKLRYIVPIVVLVFIGYKAYPSAPAAPRQLPLSAHTAGSAYVNSADDAVMAALMRRPQLGGGDAEPLAGSRDWEGEGGGTEEGKEGDTEGGGTEVRAEQGDDGEAGWKGEEEAVKQEEGGWKGEEEGVKQEEDGWKGDGEGVKQQEQEEEGGGEGQTWQTEGSGKAETERQAEEGWKGVDDDKADGEAVQGCRELIVYDKPVKTGSTAVRDALVKYLEKRGAEWVECTFDACNAAAEKMVAGETGKKNLVEHMQGADGVIERLGAVGYYKVTSIRDPRSRWESAYRYNKAQKARHYGIEPDVSYAEFMRRMPPCSLYDFYDKLGGGCEGDLDGRIAKIVKRYDEVIDLYEEEVKGQLHVRLAPFISVSNKSPEYSSDGEFDEGRLVNETRLYEALKRRRLELFGKEPPLC